MNYSPADIKKYWDGKLSQSEMHAMEKAALDDPFLADAIEGYRHSIDPDAELEQIRKRLNEKSSTSIPVLRLRKNRYGWLRVAAAVIIIIGTGLIFQQIVFQKTRDNSILQNNEIATKAEEPVTSVIDTGRVSVSNTDTNAGKLTDGLEIAKDKKSNTQSTPQTKTETNSSWNYDTSGNLTSNFSTLSAKAEEKQKNEQEGKIVGDIIADTSGYAATYKVITEQGKRSQVQKPTANGVFNSNAGFLSNSYNYRIVDDLNKPIPFANVTNTRDNVGTYTDMDGKFNLVSTDSIMNVQVKALGYASTNFSIPANKNFSILKLREDIAAKQAITKETNMVAASVTRRDTAELEEPEAGWGYYNTYVANNIQITDKLKEKASNNEVELSFDIDKTGQPINIRVTKSSRCKECDEEAIRLLREGPKWNRKNKRSKGSIKITVDK